MKKIIVSLTIFIAAHCFEEVSATDTDVLACNIHEFRQLAQEYSTTEDQNRLEIIPKQIENLLKNICSNPITIQLINNKLLEASRCPNDNELPAVNDLIAFLRSTGIEISEARYIDTVLTMPKKYINTELLTATMAFLKNPEKNAIIKDTFANSYFSNELFKSKLLHDISDICKESRLFRKLLVSLILKAKFPHVRNVTKIVFPLWKENNKLIFLESEFPQSSGNYIYFPHNFTGMHMQSFFNSRYTEKETTEGIYATTKNEHQILFHEMAHSWIGDFFMLAEKCGIDNTVKLFSRIITGINFDEDAFNIFFARLYTAPEIAKIKYIKHHNELFNTKFSTLDGVQQHLLEKCQSSEGVAEILFASPVEIIQIMGLALIKCDNRNILFINSLSDFALSVELNKPIRNDHTAYAINPSNEAFKYMLPEKLYLRHTMNLQFYGTMFKVYGSSIQEYVMKLMYGNSLFSILKSEWNLWKIYSKAIIKKLYPLLFASHK